MNFFEELQWRGLVKDIAGDDLEDKLNNEKITFYWGTDPTADSLHLGHYSSLITAKRLAKAGHHPILLVGGATGLIGDPRPTAEREIISKEAVEHNLKGLSKQVKEIVGGDVEVVNNNDWMKEFTFTDFLRDVGKYVNVNYMLDKDIIRRRLESGITFAEFAYMLIQGYDYLYLFKNKGVVLQAAGSDQWGNITTGIDLIRKMTGKQAYGFTMPLILDSNGKKFGKSEGNALWLDKTKTSSYEMYQYLINTEDEKVEEYLKVFTFLSPEEITEVIKKHNEEPHLRMAQKKLACEIITDLHGKEEFDKAVRISEALFKGNFTNLNEEEIMEAFKRNEMKEVELGKNIVDLLVDLGVASSKREAREFVSNNSIEIKGDKVNNLEAIIDENYLINNFLIIKRGKKNYYIGKI